MRMMARATDRAWMDMGMDWTGETQGYHVQARLLAAG